MPRAAIIGVGRHGSGYAAAMLNAAGIDCGHESWWNPLRRSTDPQRTDHLVDSSWCAVPDLLGRRFDGPLVLIVREPVDTITSLVHAPDWGPYLDLRHTLVPKQDRLIDFAVETWCRWTVACLRLPIVAVWRLDGPNGPPGAKEAAALARILDLDSRDPGDVGVVNPHHDQPRVELSDRHQAAVDAIWKDL